MDPHEYAQQPGQVIGAPARDPDVYAATDLMDLLVNAYFVAGNLDNLESAEQESVERFCVFANKYLAEHRVVSTGVVDGAFSLVFQGGQTVPLASEPDAPPERPESTIPLTTPKESKGMKGMPVVDNSVPITGRAPAARKG